MRAPQRPGVAVIRQSSGSFINEAARIGLPADHPQIAQAWPATGSFSERFWLKK